MGWRSSSDESFPILVKISFFFNFLNERSRYSTWRWAFKSLEVHFEIYEIKESSINLNKLNNQYIPVSERYSKLARLPLMKTGDQGGLGLNVRAVATASEVGEAFAVDGTFLSFFKFFPRPSQVTFCCLSDEMENASEPCF